MAPSGISPGHWKHTPEGYCGTPVSLALSPPGLTKLLACLLLTPTPATTVHCSVIIPMGGPQQAYAKLFGLGASKTVS
jgi:hypothetical protein